MQYLISNIFRIFFHYLSIFAAKLRIFLVLHKFFADFFRLTCDLEWILLDFLHCNTISSLKWMSLPLSSRHQVAHPVLLSRLESDKLLFLLYLPYDLSISPRRYGFFLTYAYFSFSFSAFNKFGSHFIVQLRCSLSSATH